MMQPDDPPFLTVGTEVSAKYKGAFCEAKVNKVVKVVKIKVTFKFGNGSAVVLDDCIKGALKVGAQVKALHPDKNQHIDAIINKIQDCSQYTVVFDDGDITTLRRSSLCLKSGRHFAESETLDQLPLTHPEHFGTPVVGGRRGRRSRHHLDSDEASSEEEDNVHKRHRSRREEWESDIGKIVCVEIGDKKKQKDNWFPGLVVAPTAQDTVKIETKKDYLVRSFQDGRYYTVPKKEATNFNREIGSKVSQSSLRTAVEKAYLYIDKDELPPHWDRDLLFGVDVSDSDIDKDSDSDTSDDEPREEKDHFVAQLYKYMEECGTPINKGPTIGAKDLDLYKLFKIVQKLGGFNRVMNQNQWKVVSAKMCLHNLGQSAALVKAAYKKYLQSFEDFYRKLGCTMVSSPRGSRTRHRSGRSLIRDCDKRPTKKGKGGESDSAGDDTDRKDEDTEEEDVKKEVVVKVEVEEERKPEKKEKEETPQRISTPVLPSRTMSPTTRERTKEMKSLRSERPKAKSIPKEEPKVVKKEPEEPKKKEIKEEVIPPSPVLSRKSRADDARRREVKEEKKLDTDSEEEAEEKTQKRSLRNRDGTEKETSKRDESENQKKPLSEKKVRPDPHQRSASCNSTSSGTSCTSTGTSSSTCFASDSKTGVKGKNQMLKSQTSVEDLKKRGRKKRNEEIEMPPGKPLLPAHIPVCVGDKLRVLYGPNNKESKVTYEAKVLEVEESNAQKMYYVHYLGWNTRYDEWVVRQRVAQNLTWMVNKAKKGRGASKEAEDKKSEKDEKKEKEMASSSSSSPRIATQPPKRGRPFSSGRRESERSDSASSTRTSTRSDKSNAPHSHSASPSSERPAERRRSKRNISVSNRDTEESETEESESGSDERDNDHKGNEAPSSSHQNAESSPVVSKSKKDESQEPRIKQEPVSQISSATPSPSSCGKDIDMKAIESEMKGLDKPIKKEDGLNIREVTGRILTTVIPGSLTITEKKKHDPRKPFDSPAKRVEIPVRLVPAQEIMGLIKPVPISGMKKEPLLEDDIYEFKEPEPFEFSDIRSRKECKSRAHGGSPQDEAEPEAKVKKKGRPRRDGDKSDGESDGGPITPQKRTLTPSKEVRESPAKRTEGKETPKRELKDYTRKPDLLKTPDDDKAKDPLKEPVRIVSPPCLQIRESNSECLEKPLLIDFFSKERQLPIIPLDIKDLKLDLTDPKESHFFGSSVVITPKKVPLKKETIASVEKVTPIKIEPSDTVPSRSLKLDIKEETSFSKDPPKISISPNSTGIKPTSVALDRPSSGPLISRISCPTGHVIAPVVMPPIESRVLAKPSVKPLSVEPPSEKGFIITPSTSVQALGVLKQEDRPEGKLMTFSQRQQHIFPHLLNRSETSEDKTQNVTIQRTITTTSSVTAPSVVVTPITTHPSHLQTVPEPPSVSITTLPKVSVCETKAEIEKPPSSEKLKCESTTVEESIEAVVLRARQDQTAADDEKKDIKIGEKRKRISGRSKKTVSREFVPDTSEESDNDIKFEKGEHRQKRLKIGDRGKYSPAKKGTRLSGEGDKKVMKRCDEEERANDADEEDNEGNFVPQKTPTKELIRRRKDSEAEAEKDQPGERDSRLSKKKRVSAFRRPEENEEAALGDLLCEETIPPGSPMPQDALTTDSEVPVLPTAVKHEMPFASVPTGSSFSKRGPTPLSTMQANLHKSLQQLHPSVCIQSVTKSPSSGAQPYGPIPPPTIQPNVTITSLSPNAPPHTLPTAKVSSLSFRGPSLPPIVSAPVRPPSKISVEVVPKPVMGSGTSGINVYNPEPNSPKLATNSPNSIVMPAADVVLQKVEEPKVVMPRAGPLPNLDNTPPTTPESIVSNLSDSPQRENDSSKIDETSKSGGQYSSEMETDNKLDNYSEDSNTMDSNASATKCHSSTRPSSVGARGPCQQSHSEGWDTEDGALAPPKRKKKSSRKSLLDEECIKNSLSVIAAVSASASLILPKRRRRHSSSRVSNRCEDEHDAAHGLHTLSLAACNSPRGKLKYNFCQELDPQLDQTKRIAVLQSRMQELKRTYRHVKSELASVERRRKKLKKKEKEKEAQQEGN